MPWYERVSESPALASTANATERMLHRLETPTGRALYGLLKCTVEPVFGLIKQAMRFKQFPLRGKAKVTGEWQLVAYDLKRMHRLA